MMDRNASLVLLDGDRRRTLKGNRLKAASPNSTQPDMAPKPYEDLFIEPAGDYDVVYGDYNSTMDDSSSGGKRPYLRLTSALPNVSRPVGGEIRLKCEAAGSPLPIHFTWLKNHAPVEKNRKTRIRHKDYWSKLVIVDLEVLDSGYYQCTASNAAGSVNTTAVLRVNSNAASSNQLRPKASSSANHHNNKQIHSAKGGAADDYENYDNYLDEIRPSSEDSQDFMNVPNTAAGSGYVPLQQHSASSDRWLDSRSRTKGECVLYAGQSCKDFLAGRYIKLTTENREEMYDIDRNLRAATLFIGQMRNVTQQCKRYSHAVACFHLYKVCDMDSRGLHGGYISEDSNDDVTRLCRRDCDNLKDNVCPSEFSMAAMHELVGDGPKALLPSCETLPSNPATKCIRVLEPQFSPDVRQPSQTNAPALSHWCFVDTGKWYEGTASTTKSNKKCLPWPKSTTSEFNSIDFPELKTAGNQCRNPSGRRAEPFCYTLPMSESTGTISSLTPIEESCGLPRCPQNLYPQLRDDNIRPPGRNDYEPTTPPLLDSLSNVWKSLSSQWQVAALSGFGAVIFLALLLFICCVCCCRRKGRNEKNRRKCSSSNMGANSATTIIHNNESSSSMISSNILKKNNMALQSCNGGSSIANSDMNSAFMRKRDEANRMRGAGDEMLNPLLRFGVPNQPPPQLSQQQMFELQQKYCWANSDGYSGAGSHPPSHLQFHQSQQQMFVAQAQDYSPHTSAEPPAEPYQIPTIQEQQLKFDKVLGEDATTIVYLGEWLGGMISGAALQVAIKTLKPGAGHIAVENLREEIKEVGPFEHLNVVRVFGVAYLSQQNISAVFDYMVHGDLHEFLKVREPRGNENDEKERLRNAEDFLRISTQITAGMDYLASNGYVHRDLAARNCLVGDQLVIKISDFGRMKSCYDHDYYRLNANARVPLRWLSKEALNEAKYSHASDVFAFGVTLWEIYSYGRQPYEDFSNQQVIKMINDEAPLELPTFCPPIVYGVMIECWHSNAKRRPTFSELHSRFQKWCASGQPQALMVHNNNRASSVHSGGSSNAGGSACAIPHRSSRPVDSNTAATSSSANSQPQQLRGSSGGMLDQFGSVPSPAPNSCNNLNSAGGQISKAKLTMLSNGNTIVHSTPIGRRSPKIGDTSPLMPGAVNARIAPTGRRRTSSENYLYSDEDYSTEDNESG